MAVTETRTLPAQFIEDLGKDYAKQLTATTAIPIDTSKFAPTVAAQDALQTQAATLAGTGVGSFQPFIQAAQQQATAAGQTLGDVGTTLSGIAGLTGAPTAAQTQAFTSPFQQQVIDTTLAEFDRQRAIQEQNIKSQQAGLGALGSGRAGVQLAEFGTGSDRERAALQAQLLQQGFQDAAARRQQDLANQVNLAGQQLQAGQFQTGLARLVPSLQTGDIRTLGSVGAVQQAQSQAQLDAQREANRLAAFEPYERLGTFGSGVASLISGYPGQRQFTSVPNPTPLQTALGIGTGLAGLYGALR